MTPSLPDRVVLLGSGALKIGEAGEFDYSGSQCLKALDEDDVYAIIVNPNIATLQTDPPRHGKVYFQPVVADFVAPILEAERPDGLLLSFGGQTALNCGIALNDRGTLAKTGTRVLGTPLAGIRATEDRARFVRSMARARVPTLPSRAVRSIDEALGAAEQLGFPLMVRVAFTLGGKGGGVAKDAAQLREVVQRGLRASPVRQVLLERYVGSFKQIEYEVVRDDRGNALTVCNMENVLGMRVHTGDNIVIAPSQTLTDEEYQLLRQAALRAVAEVGIVGECNIQFCLEPNSLEYYAIEINARLSRSSALASKATGYPLAYVAAKLALGYTLPELKNRITGVTTACFEPSLDYVVVKLPRWDLEKFAHADPRLGPAMKSVGEAMGIGRRSPRRSPRRTAWPTRGPTSCRPRTRGRGRRSSPTSPSRRPASWGTSWRRCGSGSTRRRSPGCRTSTGGSSTRSPRSRRSTGRSPRYRAGSSRPSCFGGRRSSASPTAPSGARPASTRRRSAAAASPPASARGFG